MPSPVADIQHYMRAGTLQLKELPPLSLYIHLPWCIRKCPYCDFNSHALAAPQADDGQQRMAHYLQALEADLDAALPLIWGRSVISIFIGGGTPSLFSARQIDQLLASVRARLRLMPGCEVTLEANPGTFETDRFAAYREAGVTRLSIGVQSFNDEHLQKLGRVHSRAQALAAVEEARGAFETFNLDLMYALPGQSLAMLDEDLATALALAPAHLSVYHLTIEPNTFFAKYPPPLPGDDLAYEMLDHITAATARHGLQRYEVSAYARAGHQCVHNLNYWQFGDYLGIGAGAHSKLSFAHRIIRQVRVRDPQRYMAAALQQQAVAQETEVPRQDLPFEFMLNALRLREGFELPDYLARTGMPLSSIEAGVQQGLALGLLERPDGDNQRIRPTERGFDFLSDLQEVFIP
ncbi:oxygen-independent coproporphyrinogen III oxidase-like protein [Corticibacter populi]|uniref:Heme chaperone HemW n=1 Tax=Corticibacter populi TaxID=1550736 RepID=A0A3M6R0U6_9BURK|nr:radical SAM family heme chaperone HemW [Corticibacter populi]RMX08886.1 oxygen-independent coproporphyrinogen III oxidase-like protein [Corticibacter populi]RZS35628.1 oxygen-independent coproporphyrinogen-3 oxidase [Corticibacter populi]